MLCYQSVLATAKSRHDRLIIAIDLVEEFQSCWSVEGNLYNERAKAYDHHEMLASGDPAVGYMHPDQGMWKL